MGDRVCKSVDPHPKYTTNAPPTELQTTPYVNSTAVNDASIAISPDEPCDDLQPEKAKVNFLLLLMNGVRVVFTKVVAFSTLLTIRAVLA